MKQLAPLTTGSRAGQFLLREIHGLGLHPEKRMSQPLHWPGSQLGRTGVCVPGPVGTNHVGMTVGCAHPNANGRTPFSYYNALKATPHGRAEIPLRQPVLMSHGHFTTLSHGHCTRSAVIRRPKGRPRGDQNCKRTNPALFLVAPPFPPSCPLRS
jgi:hypothetical protein